MATVLPRAKSLAGLALDLLFPQWCIGCGREGEVVCRKCQKSFPTIGSSFCQRCGRPIDEEECRNCAGIHMTIDGIRAPFLFQGLVRQAIHELKYRNFRAVAPFLARELASYLDAYPLSAQALIAVPLHARRLRERGYNQSSLISRSLSRLTGLPVLENRLIRQRNTLSLARAANREARREIIAGSFSVAGNLEGKDVILIDDVSTTGTTLDACAVVLKKAGAGKVWGLVVALEL